MIEIKEPDYGKEGDCETKHRELTKNDSDDSFAINKRWIVKIR